MSDNNDGINAYTFLVYLAMKPLERKASTILQTVNAIGRDRGFYDTAKYPLDNGIIRADRTEGCG